MDLGQKEIINKINKENIIWFALTIILVVFSILLSKSTFSKLTQSLESLSLPKTGSIILIFLLYLSISIVVIRAIISILKTISAMIINYQKNKAEEKKFKSLNEKEYELLLLFAISQKNRKAISTKDIPLARILVKKGFLNHCGGYQNVDGSEDFFMEEDILNEITELNYDKIQELRATITSKGYRI